MEYSKLMEKQTIMARDMGDAIKKSTGDIKESVVRMETGVKNAIDEQTFAIVASSAALARTYKEGFDKVNKTLDMGFYGISNQLGHMTAAFSAGFDQVTDNLKQMSKEICDRLDAIHDIARNPRLTEARELYRNAFVNYNKGFFEEALEDIKAAVEKNKTDYFSWFLQGKIYLFGASEFSNVIDLDMSIQALTSAAKYISPDINVNKDAKLMAAEIWFYLGFAKYNKSRDLNSQGREAEAKTILDEATAAFERSWGYSDNMLEARYFSSRCKALAGDVDGALSDLCTVITKDRNYCIKVFGDSDYDSMRDKYINLIERLKHDVFTEAKAKYDKIKILDGALASSGSSSGESIPAEFSESLPYFDILDYNVEFDNMLPRIVSLKQDKEEEYDKLVREKNHACNEKEWYSLAEQFRAMNGYKDTAKLAADCENEYRVLKDRREEQKRKDMEAWDNSVNNWVKKGLCQKCGGKMHQPDRKLLVKVCKSCGWKVKRIELRGGFHDDWVPYYFPGGLR